MDNNAVSGLLLNDITDHLPVVVMYNCDYSRKTDDDQIRHRRVRTEESLNVFRSEL